mmetsp:Transcript_100269/g.223815  ORF Transcript_100269/g.223815 Transcript_100269/m.223815 type:complete len:609 (+) Transcript_100269:182-2008(+)
MLLQVVLHLLYDIPVVGPLLGQPEDSWRPGTPGPDNRQLDPILNGGVLRLAHAPDVALFHLMGEDHLAGLPLHHPHCAVLGYLEGLVVRAVLLSLRSHKPHIRRGTHLLHIEGAILLTILHDLVVHRRVAPVRDHELCIAELIVLGPHAARVTNGCGHGSIDDHVRWHMQIRDALPRVHICELRPREIASLDVCLHLGLLQVTGDLCVDVTKAILRVHPELIQEITMLVEGGLVVDVNGLPEENGVRDLHHRRLQVQGEKCALLCALELLLVEVSQGGDVHEAAIDDLPWQQRRLRLEHLCAAGVHELDAHTADLLHHRRLLALEKVALAHVCDMAFRIRRVSAHFVGICLGVRLHRRCNTAVRISLPQHRVHRTSQDLAVPRADVVLLLVFRFCRKVRHRKTFALKLRDRGKQLGHRCRNIWQLDDVGSRRFCEPAQALQVILDLLVRCQEIREEGSNTRCQRNILLHNLNARSAAISSEHRKEGVRGKHGCLVRVSVNDLHIRDLELHVIAGRVELLLDLELRPWRQIVQPLGELHSAVLVLIEGCKKLVHIELASRQIQILEGRCYFRGIQRPAAVTVVTRECLRQNGELLLGGLGTLFDDVRSL